MTVPEYDVIVVGAGSAGSALAARLSETPSRSVLVLEAGEVYGSLEEFPPELMDASSMQAALPGHPAAWSFHSSLRPGRRVPIPRGRVMGGTSSMNGAYFIRGTRDDFDGWAGLAGESWSFDQVLPYFRRLESDKDFGGDHHGHDGPIPVERDSDSMQNPLTQAFFEAATAMGFPEEPDKNASGPPGVGLVPRNVRGSTRWNAGVAYLVPALDRPNLSVRGGVEVRRVVVEGGRAVGVEIVDRAGAEVVGGGEIVLCAGAIETPRLLLASGIGPAEESRRHGLEVVADLGGVGTGFSDHPMITVPFRGDTRIDMTHGSAAVPACLNFGSDGSSDLQIVLRTMTFSRMMLRSSAGSSLAGLLRVARRPVEAVRHVRRLSLGVAREYVTDRNAFALGVTLQRPDARGTIRLAPGDPYGHPVIAHRYLEGGADRDRLRHGVRTAEELLGHHAFRRIGVHGGIPIAPEDDMDEYLSARVGTAMHLSGSCPMGRDPDAGAVVDGRCRVFGVQALRVVDTSIMPRITTRGPAATAVMMGERAADLID